MPANANVRANIINPSSVWPKSKTGRVSQVTFNKRSFATEAFRCIGSSLLPHRYLITQVQPIPIGVGENRAVAQNCCAGLDVKGTPRSERRSKASQHREPVEYRSTVQSQLVPVTAPRKELNPESSWMAAAPKPRRPPLGTSNSTLNPKCLTYQSRDFRKSLTAKLK